ncbi:MAG: hypothetical protein K1X88_34765, partial [Nannocystaceae bacterium]|nr:hypothetical protein [Nannocystaceae bacterium]
MGWRSSLIAASLLLACAQDDPGVGFQAWQSSSPGGVGSGPVTSAGDDGDDDDDDDDESSSGGGDATTSATGAPASDGGNDDGNDDGSVPAGSSDGGDTGSGNPVLDACLEIAVNDCETCACNLCLDPLYACQQDPGCVAMRDCAQQAGCAG